MYRQECHCYHSHIFPDFVNQRAGTHTGETKDGGSTVSDIAFPSGQVRYTFSENIKLYTIKRHHILRDIQLKKRVSAEKIESVTIYYSDLVNFNDLYTDSSPVEVEGRGGIHTSNINIKPTSKMLLKCTIKSFYVF